MPEERKKQQQKDQASSKEMLINLYSLIVFL